MINMGLMGSLPWLVFMTIIDDLETAKVHTMLFSNFVYGWH